MGFKNALCYSMIPEADWAGWSARYKYCRRKKGHKGEHRIVFADKNIRVWREGENQSRVLTPKEEGNG